MNKKQRKFKDEYLKDFNATRAAERAGYSGDENTLSSVAHKLLRNAEISAAIKKHMEESAMTAHEALARLAKMARGSMADFIRIDEAGHATIDLQRAEEWGVLDLVKKLKLRERVVEAGQEETTIDRTIEIELHDSLRALELICRALGLFKPDVQIQNNLNMPIVVMNPDAMVDLMGRIDGIADRPRLAERIESP